MALRCGPLLALAALAIGCPGPQGGPRDAGGRDAGQSDGAGHDGGGLDGGDAGPNDAGQSDAGDGGTFAEAPHDPFPQLPFHGGPILATPALVTVVLGDHPLRAEVEAYGVWLAGSAYLREVGADYGVGTGTARAVELDGGIPALAGEVEVAAFLEGQFDAGTVPVPSTLTAPLYVLYFPPDAGLGGVCTTVFSYHAAASYEGTPFPFVVDADCPESVTGYPDLEEIELTASHEILEAATDPFPSTDAGYRLTDPASLWYLPSFGETADLCEGAVFLDPDGGFYAQRIWSNSEAALGTQSPCLPEALPYFNASPSPDTVQSVAPGAVVQFTLTGFSTAPVPAWGIAVMATFGDFDAAPSLDAGTLQNGEATVATLTVPADAGTGARAQVWIGSYVQGGSDWTGYWPVEVVVR